VGGFVTRGKRGKRARGGRILEVSELRLGRVPDLDCVGVVAHYVFQVDGEGAAVALERIVAGALDALSDVEDDGGKAVLVEVDLLVIRDFADRARRRVRRLAASLGGRKVEVYLTSAKFSGRSHTRAPPKRSVFL
jgi:hypothetical protein